MAYDYYYERLSHKDTIKWMPEEKKAIEVKKKKID